MSHFQRSAYQVAQHFTHDYPGAPLRVHPVQPLMPMEVSYSGYGYTPSDFVSGRKWLSTLRETGANTAVYAAYDNYADLDEIVTRKIGGGRNYKTGMSDLTLISTWSDMSTVAASNSGAKLKTAYMLKLAGLILNDTELKTRAEHLAEAGMKEGEAPGSGSLRSDIKSTYANALSALKNNAKYKSQSSSQPLVQIAEALQKGTGQEAVQARAKQYTEDQSEVKKNIPESKGGTKTEGCEDSWKSYIPGLCTAEAAGDMLSLAVKVVGGVAVAGVVFWGAKKVIRGAKSVKDEAAANPRRMLTTRSNPSAPGRTDYGPEEEIAQMPKARAQEQAMMKNVFKRKV